MRGHDPVEGRVERERAEGPEAVDGPAEREEGEEEGAREERDHFGHRAVNAEEPCELAARAHCGDFGPEDDGELGGQHAGHVDHGALGGELGDLGAAREGLDDEDGALEGEVVGEAGEDEERARAEHFEARAEIAAELRQGDLEPGQGAAEVDDEPRGDEEREGDAGEGQGGEAFAGEHEAELSAEEEEALDDGDEGAAGEAASGAVDAAEGARDDGDEELGAEEEDGEVDLEARGGGDAVPAADGEEREDDGAEGEEGGDDEALEAEGAVEIGEEGFAIAAGVGGGHLVYDVGLDAEVSEREEADEGGEGDPLAVARSAPREHGDGDGGELAGHVDGRDEGEGERAVDDAIEERSGGRRGRRRAFCVGLAGQRGGSERGAQTT